MPNPSSFLPSQDGLAFTNSWPSEPAVVLPTPFGKINIGNAASGLCGGMVFAVLDFWHAGIQPPATRPAPGEPLYRYIVQRLVDSWHLPAGVAQYYQWMNLPDGDSGFEVLGRRVVTDRVYDPNSGQDDGIYIRFDPRAPAKPTTFAHNINISHPVRGFFRTAYAPATPPAS